ncbi:ABC transporter permease [Streptomyces sp. DSM 42041]|uniref:ABC transporter permease n=1 Tax=Streptomyces hazeniae TaxID=3075538 RepID=A0ABU2P043_9ACTN|nr:ABC transporter permease [Streptomyces sp. DSM 42041]MDT0382619.1 ABC transporter permease [Streptomyces sp. DSM 42041]
MTTDITRRSLAALTRAELTLLVRNKTHVFTVFLAPALLTLGMIPVFDTYRMPMSTLVPTMAATALGFTLVMGVYSTLTATYVVRREGYVLKRFRTGQASDTVLLGGTAVPVVLTSALQALLLVVGIAAVTGTLPGRPLLLLVGFLLGIPLTAAFAAITSAWTRTAESAGVSVFPGMMVLLLTSGMLIPFSALPDVAGDVAQVLPFTPVVELVKHGWSGEVVWAQDLARIAALLVWNALLLVAARRVFKWEPRT